jgi:hypothetical protein
LSFAFNEVDALDPMPEIKRQNKKERRIKLPSF